MKKILTTLLFFSIAAMLHAAPAKPGQWKTVKLADGSTIRVELRGDEHSKWWQAEDGRMFVKAKEADYYVATDAAALQKKTMKRRIQTGKAQAKRAKAMRKAPNPMFQGQRKGLIILVQFTDTKFQSGHDVALYEKIANAENYTDNGFYGSVRDYFKAQSGGQFDLSFDVKGIVTLNHPYAYYGGNDNDDNDQRPGEMIVDALEAVKTQINIADYDWDNDGEAEEVFVLYAGKGEADGGDDDTIWPHMWSLYEANGAKWSYNGYTVDTYACSAELNGYGQLDGVGTFCHEFSHCMGFPDMYDTSYGGNYGMGDYDLMCGGSYNGNGRIPAGYSAYERAICGWMELNELTGTDAVTNLKPVNQGGEAYVVYNQGHTDEYFVIENRQQTGWDSSLPGKGLLISYVDYDQTVWEYNIPNTICDYSSYANYYPDEADFWRNYKNDHQRLTIFHADNKSSSDNIYPYGSNNKLTNTSSPAGKTYHANSDGSKYMNIAITEITQNSDGTMSFNYKPEEPRNVVKPDHTNAIFYESFDKHQGTGGWDDKWTGSVASSNFNPDMSGWTSSKSYGGKECARFGNASNAGTVTTPSFNINGETSFAFMAAPWGTDGTTLNLSVEGNATITPTTVTMEPEVWSTFYCTINGTGSIKVKFTPVKRLFLDEVVAKTPDATGISEMKNEELRMKNAGWFTVDGRRLNAQPTQKGVYIHNGKKVIVK